MEKICINGRDALFVLDLAKVACFQGRYGLYDRLLYEWAHNNLEYGA